MLSITPLCLPIHELTPNSVGEDERMLYGVFEKAERRGTDREMSEVERSDAPPPLFLPDRQLAEITPTVASTSYVAS